MAAQEGGIAELRSQFSTLSSDRNRVEALEAQLSALRAASASGHGPAHGIVPTETASAREQRRLLEEVRDQQERQMQAMAETKSEVTEMSDRVEGLELENLYGGQVPSNTSAASERKRHQGAIRAMLVVSGLQRIRPKSASPPRRRARNDAELRQQESDRLGGITDLSTRSESRPRPRPASSSRLGRRRSPTETP